MPILYLTELMGVAFGDSRTKSWFGKHMVSPEKILGAKGLI
jgi:heterodisulfide reductase subunit B